jgi:hypothetical protein
MTGKLKDHAMVEIAAEPAIKAGVRIIRRIHALMVGNG